MYLIIDVETGNEGTKKESHQGGEHNDGELDHAST
jgi:hypothetical protein